MFCVKSKLAEVQLKSGKKSSHQFRISGRRQLDSVYKKDKVASYLVLTELKRNRSRLHPISNPEGTKRISGRWCTKLGISCLNCFMRWAFWVQGRSIYNYGVRTCVRFPETQRTQGIPTEVYELGNVFVFLELEFLKQNSNIEYWQLCCAHE